MTFLNLLLFIALFFDCNKDDSTQIDSLPNLSKIYNIVDTGTEDFYNSTTIISMPKFVMLFMVKMPLTKVINPLTKTMAMPQLQIMSPE